MTEEIREEIRDLTIAQALDLGCEMAMAGNHQGAVGLFTGVLRHEPQNFEAIERLGSSLFELERYHEALYWFWRGRKINRRHPMALTNYGLAVSQLGHWDEGVVELQKAAYLVERKPLAPEAMALIYNNLGNTLERLQRYPEALVALDRGIAYHPQDAFPHYNRGIVLLRLNRQAEAVAAFDRALAIRPGDAEALYNRSMARLLLGELAGGFADYESRLVTSENKVPNLGLPAEKKWTGAEDLSGKTILVHCEQGLGDDIQCFRFLAGLRTRGAAKIEVMAHRETAVLLEGCPDVTVLRPGMALPVYDYWVALMSLPLCLNAAGTGIPVPWRPKIEPERIAKWRAEIDPVPDRLNIGICWAGNWQHKNDRHRSIALEVFAKLLDAPGCRFISLQQIRAGETEAFAALLKRRDNLRALWFDDFRDTAAAMLCLDGVVSVDTAIAHLSATLGVPTSILLPAFGTDWRWQLGREDSPWYPSARLYRQPKVGDWASVIVRVRGELAATAAPKRAA